MSTFACPHCGQHTSIFGDAGGQRMADEYGVPLLARLPLDPETRVGGDEGTPITVRRPDSAQARGVPEPGRRRRPGASTSWARWARCRRSADAPGMAAPVVIVPIFPLPDVTFFPHTLHAAAHLRGPLPGDGDGRARARTDDWPWCGCRPATRRPTRASRTCTRWPGSARSSPASGWRPGATTSCCAARRASGSSASCRATRSTGSCVRTGSPDVEAGDAAPALARIRAACRTLLDALQRPADLLDTALAEGQGAGAIADRVAAAVLPGRRPAPEPAGDPGGRDAGDPRRRRGRGARSRAEGRPRVSAPAWPPASPCSCS